MYNLPYFKEKNHGEILAFMRKHPFAMLCGCSKSGRPVVTQVPVLLKEDEGKLTIEGHVMKNTDHHKAFLENDQALVVFSGAHAYVSASWYSNPNQASTWNYMSVHARGSLQFLVEDELRRILEETTTKYEQGKESLASYHNLKPDYIDRLIKAIVGFRLVVDEIENVFKLSQNRDEKSFHSILDELRSGDADAQKIATEMERIKTGLFNERP